MHCIEINVHIWIILGEMFFGTCIELSKMYIIAHRGVAFQYVTPIHGHNAWYSILQIQSLKSDELLSAS